MIQVISTENMRKSDAETIASGIPARELMRRAGAGMVASYHWRGPVAIVAGSGNNAGDGYVMALCFQKVQIPCHIFLVADKFSEDGRYYFEQCKSVNIPFSYLTEETDFSDFAEICDCLLGTGFSGEVRDAYRLATEKINASQAFVFSADINSGLGGNSGAGEICVKSDLTVSVGTPQPGHFLGRAKDVIGTLENIDVGILPLGEKIGVCEMQDFGSVLKVRPYDSHKGDWGYVTVMGGCRNYGGAAKLANLSASALRSGCGVVKLAVPKSLCDAVSPYLLESTLCPIPQKDGQMIYDKAAIDQALSGVRAVAVGMGWGRSPEYEKILTYLLEDHSLRLVIDADGLNTLSAMDLSILKQTACKVVLTPHPKEFERLSGITVEKMKQNPILFAREFAEKWGVTLLLKGTATVVTEGEQTLIVNRGCPGMGTAGSGDVLSGVLCGLLGYNEPTPLSVACGAYLSGLAGELAQKDSNPISMTAGDTVQHLPQAISLVLEEIAKKR